MNPFVKYLHSHAITCSIKSTFGVECPGCGFQSSLIALLSGDIATSIHAYPALIPLITLWGLLISHLIFKFRHGAKTIQYLFIFCTFIIALNYIIKLTH